ncbi:MAG: tRNA threonylcarbamoyl adenosine modification protein (Sua5/YciO/YrdC/YwlC family) [Pirellulaceae bacterium]|jgi:tRNA threonylcarbamoyl adenosine modification protein (Sua5/YciO/YrdC/YwlC family)
MPPKIIDLNRAEDPRDVVHRAVQALAEGKLVAFPTETVYGVAASALREDAVEKLVEAKGRAANNPLTLAVKSADDALDFVPAMSNLGRRLARRCWPGPVTLVMDNDHPESAVRQLSPLVQQMVAPNGSIGLRVPAHPLILSVLRLIAGPLALTSANQSGQPDAVTCDEVVESLGESLDLVLDDGRSKFAQPSSVVHVADNHLKILRSGVITEANLKRLSSYMVLLVCTGNTCRSPMAEILAKKRIADKIGCSLEELEDRGVLVMSAGIAAMSGGRSTPEAVRACKERDLDLTQHESQPLSERLLRHADCILTMTRGHRDAILSRWPELAQRTQLLCRDGSEVSDPIGGPIELYRQCADQIDSQLEAWLPDFDLEEISTENPGE